MVTIASAENALKTLYLGVVSEQLNTQVNPLLAKIKQSTTDVWGKEVRKLVPYGANGGIGAGTEDGLLPAPAGNNYEQFQLTLKNLYGTIEISDKAMRASANNSGAFVNLLNAEMEGLVKASKFNFGRMLFGDGSGVLATVSSATGNVLTLDSVKNVMEGMVVDVLDSDGVSKVASRRITIVDRTAKSITLSGAAIAASTIAEDDVITVQGSFNKEITGLGAIFSDSDYLYGLKRSDNKWLSPKSYAATSGAIDDATIQKVIDEMEDVSGSSADFIVCSSGVRRAYQKYLAQNRTNVDVMNLEGGFKAISYNGIPVVTDRFAPEGNMYILNTSEFTLHQLCDWRWLEGDDGRVLKQVANKPVFTATLVKYADLLCEKPMATTYIDCDGMVLQAHNSHVILLEAMRTLFAPGFARLHQLIPEIGTLRRITAGYCQYSSRYDSYLSGGRPNAFDPRLNNAAVADLGVYCIAPTIAMAGEPQKVLSCCNKLGEFEAQGGALAQYPTFLADWRWSKIADSPLPSAIEGEKGAILIGKWDTMSPLTLCLRGQEPKPIPIEDETSPLYAELDAFISMIKRRGGNEGYLSISLATCRVLDEIAKQNKITFRQTCWNMVVHRDD